MKSNKLKNIFLGIIAINLTLLTLFQLNIWPSTVNANELTSTVNYGLVPLNEDGSINVNINSSSGIMDVNIQKVIGLTPGMHESYTLGGEKYYGLDVTINN